ncbi:MAG: glycosyltransferase family 4 protein [Planctomycetota bacterium]
MLSYSNSPDPKNLRVLLRQPALPHYRVPIFRCLAQRPGIVLRVAYHGNASIPNVPPEGLDAEERFWQERRWPGIGPLYIDRQLRQLVRDHRADVVILAWNVRQVDLFKFMRWAKKQRIGVVLWGHGYSKQEAGWRRWLRFRAARKAHAVVTYNRQTAQELAEAEIDRSKVFVAANALDQTENFTARRYWSQRPDELQKKRVALGLGTGPIIGFVSRMDPMNRLDLLVKSLPLIRESCPDAQVVIVGKGDEEHAKLRAIAREQGVEDAVHIFQSIYGTHEVGALFSMFEVFCYPSNIGLSLLHAFAFGLPVVTSDATEKQNPEIESLIDRVNGRLYPHNNLAMLAKVLVDLLTNPLQRKRLGDGALRTVEEEYTTEHMVDGLEAAVRYAANTASS